jgi:Domain of unknown function (DUF4276)
MVRLAAIVEGDGECEAVPILVRRIALTLDPTLSPLVHPVIRVPASRLVKQGEIERAIELAARKNAGRGGILVFLDCDDGCPALDGPALLKRAATARPDLPVSVVLAKREFEAWFLAAAESLRGQRGLDRWKTTCLTNTLHANVCRPFASKQRTAQNPTCKRSLRSHLNKIRWHNYTVRVSIDRNITILNDE